MEYSHDIFANDRSVSAHDLATNLVNSVIQHDQLLADLAALRQDKARLEWFQQEAPVILLVDDKWEIDWNISDDGESSQQASGPTLRAAIDAAMAPAQAKEGM
jgi:hypothetical protein